MSWTRLDDRWTDSTAFEQLSFADRWHYLALIQFCSRMEKFEGVLRMVDARRCSDHPDPDLAVLNLADAGLVELADGLVTVKHIADHVPPPSVRENAQKSKIRMQRMRKHKAGDHSECLPKSCDLAPASNGLNEVTRNTGTGQDGTGQALDHRDSSASGTGATTSSGTPWPVVSIPQVPEALDVAQEPAFPLSLPAITCNTFGCSEQATTEERLCPKHTPGTQSDGEAA